MGIQAGLGTDSADQPLRSNGMIGVLLRDGIVVSLLLCGTAWLLFQYGGFELPVDTIMKRLGIAVFAILPALALYLMLRLLFMPIASGAISLASVGALIAGQRQKSALTGMPLTWDDVINVSNLRVASHYLSEMQWLAICAALLVLAALAGRSLCWRRHGVRHWLRGCVPKSTLLAAVLPFVLHPYLPETPVDMRLRMSNLLYSRLDIRYVFWNWPVNVRDNGLLVHLIQTSRRTLPKAVPPDEARQRLAALGTLPAGAQAPRHIFLILCEACWFDQEHFSNIFQPLRNAGFTEIRAISPVYGGGTANTEFEMLTALPSHGALNGLIYQEYGDAMAPATHTIAASLQTKGYRTIALHDFHRDFYKRNIVLQKLGLERFIALEDMGYYGPRPMPRDSLLFDTALRELRQNLDRKMFFDLITVYTHGPYPFQGDWGERDYASRLASTVNDLAHFVQEVRALSPDALFIVYGDHKPALTRYFYENKVLAANMFEQIGKQNDDFLFSRLDIPALGDAPVLVLSPDTARVSELKRIVQGKPYYCVAAGLDALFYGSDNPASVYDQRHICADYRPGTNDAGYRKAARSVPGWLYAISLFSDSAAPATQH